MPNKLRRPCTFPGCPLLTDDGKCDEHKRLAWREDARLHPDRAPYRKTERWKRFMGYMKARNWRCQWLSPHTGEQCAFIATIGHHLVSPKDDESLTYEETNIVMVCSRHHPNTSGHDGISKYVPTIVGD